MRVYRIETEREGRKGGPFYWYPRNSAMMPDEFGWVPGAGPTPGKDGLGYEWDYCGDTVCATVSYDQLRKWFRRRHCELLEQDGFVLAEYEVPDTARVPKGTWQCLPRIKDMKHICDRPPTDLWKECPA